VIKPRIAERATRIGCGAVVEYAWSLEARAELRRRGAQDAADQE
jgi:hypothetical protein